MKVDAVSSDRLVRFLSDPASYPHRPRNVRMVQTHASWVFIASPYVFKVKKAVNFGFLDFSTLAKRRHFCEREVALNRRLSPDTYLGVIPITLSGRRLALGGDSPIVEYAVKMRRLPDGGFLNKLVETGKVGRKEINRIAGVLARFYLSQHPSSEVEEWGRIDCLKISTNENFRQTKSFVGKTITRPAFEVIRAWTNRFYETHPRLFDSRVRERWIRDCHGDLHLDHIHLTKDAISIYDCIEFNDRFRYVDVANDLAFLAMDLDFRGRFDLAGHLVRRMAAQLADENLGRLMTFYKCYRAYVRGKVESLHSVTPKASEEERQTSADQAARYFRLALRYVVAGSSPLVLVVMGRIASGKSTLARALGDELGWPVISSDQVRKEIAGVSPHRRVDGRARMRLYSAAMTAKTYGQLLSAAERLAQSGRCVIVDATFSRKDQRRMLIDRLNRRGIAYRFVEATASDRTIKARLRAREGRTNEVSDARFENFAALSARYQPPVELGTKQRIGVSCVHLSDAVVRTLRALAGCGNSTVDTGESKNR